MELAKRHEICTLTCIPGPNAQLKLGSWKKDNSWNSSSPGWQILESKNWANICCSLTKEEAGFTIIMVKQTDRKLETEKVWQRLRFCSKHNALQMWSMFECYWGIIIYHHYHFYRTSFSHLLGHNLSHDPISSLPQLEKQATINCNRHHGHTICLYALAQTYTASGCITGWFFSLVPP